MRRGGCVRWTVREECPSACGTKGVMMLPEVGAGGCGQQRGKRGAAAKGCWGRDHSLEVDSLQEESRILQLGKDPCLMHSCYSIAAVCAQHQLTAGSTLGYQRLAELPCPTGASAGDLQSQQGVIAETGAVMELQVLPSEVLPAHPQTIPAAKHSCCCCTAAIPAWIHPSCSPEQCTRAGFLHTVRMTMSAFLCFSLKRLQAPQPPVFLCPVPASSQAGLCHLDSCPLQWYRIHAQSNKGVRGAFKAIATAGG